MAVNQAVVGHVKDISDLLEETNRNAQTATFVVAHSLLSNIQYLCQSSLRYVSSFPRCRNALSEVCVELFIYV